MADRRTNSFYGSRRRRPKKPDRGGTQRQRQRQGNTRHPTNTHKGKGQSSKGKHSSIINAISDVLSVLKDVPAYVVMDVVFGVFVLVGVIIIALNFDDIIDGLYYVFIYPLMQILSGLISLIIIIIFFTLVIRYIFRRR